MDNLVLTVDVEWHYHGDKTGNVADFDQKSLEERFAYDKGQIEKSVDAILKILKKHQQKITFFTVAEIDKIYPQVLKRINNQGHEIAIHSYRHHDLETLTALKSDLKQSASFKKKYRAVGYRSPRVKMKPNYYPILKKFGYQYDSSAYGTTKFSFKGIKILPLSVLPYKKHVINRISSPLNFELLKEAIPFGGGLTTSFFQKFEKFFINQYFRLFKEPPCLLLHSWQVKKPYYPLKFLLKNPLMIPYSRECEDLLKYFCQNYQLLRVKDYLL